MILVLDNFDSFTWNLVALLRELGKEVVVRRNDEPLSALVNLNPASIIISPGPGRPQDAGVSWNLLEAFAGKVPVLGICLGHQLIGEWTGASLNYAIRPMHGHVSIVKLAPSPLFDGLPQSIQVMRYHSLCLEKKNLPRELECIAETEQAEVMAIYHKSLNLAGLQFHPESCLTPDGKQIIQNWLNLF
jgi:anthranilate synthase/aminodeoxychorismate synthase-like glutamine amidotransferase